jgi:putative hydrolase of the HAD superfamily
MPSDLIFDFFGTLVHYTAGSFHTAPYERTHTFLIDHGFLIDYATFVELYTGVATDLETQAKQTAREYHMDDVARAFFQVAFDKHVPMPVVQGFVAAFIAEWSRGIRYNDSIQALLSELATHYRLSILSNTHYPALIHDNLAQMDVAPYFTHILTSIEHGWRKPHPSIFHQMLADLDIAGSDALYIGDTYTDDYEGATAAGIRALLIDPHDQYPAVVDKISSLFDVRRLLKELE